MGTKMCVYSPSCEEGRSRRSSKRYATEIPARPGRSNPYLHDGLTSLKAARCRACAPPPLRRFHKVAFHSFGSAQRPLLAGVHYVEKKASLGSGSDKTESHLLKGDWPI